MKTNLYKNGGHLKTYMKIFCITAMLFSMSFKVFSQDSVKVAATRIVFETSCTVFRSHQ